MIIIFCGLIYLTKHHKNYEKRTDLNLEYIKIVSINYSLVCTLTLLLIIFRSYIFSNTYLPSLRSITLHFLVIDAIFYWLHRTTHRIPFLKQFFHGTHHDSFNLVPLDSFHGHTLEYVLYMVSTNLIPLYFLPINIIEYFIVFMTVLVHSVYTHTESELGFIIPLFADATFHKHHHQIGRGNYSHLFPIWDDYMKTRIPAPNKRSMTKTQKRMTRRLHKNKV